ncbi:uncharacterized protein A1O9_12484 [Exophiala aquamarina CBS 119918]|uniref:Mediator of RNA polymerase II transcription subunit 13 n=1 Tax=Exophiala aquamarina CBS 119918 TaxID=1182545 RepID=A0A072NVY6_9EURO|nr:uncharacterized protein A1O9_12484 [Exophiala aquamarina CBS 119918]KEF51567.1 hypothetical protein A1O9_12484 [Exophiala aquamarina CBS 119918]
MAAALDFPSNCATNVYTLNDFGEIAYIVCTVANPPIRDPSVTSNTRENTVARLRRTERQFREASILAALDVDALQLFTFYKKIDIANAKDQKTLLSKFGFVLRSNTCTIAYKTAARLADLMKPDQGRLYRLFTTAIISSLRLSPSTECEVQSLGPNLYLIEYLPPASDVHEFESPRRWVLFRVDLQVILSGHIILTIASNDNLSFVRLREALRHGDYAPRTTKCMTLYLAPIGSVARLTGPNLARLYSRIQDGLEAPGHEISSMEEDAWKEMLPWWLRDQMNYTNDPKNVPWVEVQIPIQKADMTWDDSSLDSSPDSLTFESISWKSIFWPANLCFIWDREKGTPRGAIHNIEDPLQFVQTWITGAAGGPVTDMSQNHQNAFEDDEEPLFTEDGTFDDPEHFQPFGPPAFAASQTIYPTPPDVIMTHTTPGLSVDCIPVTPGNIARENAELPQLQDEEMPDFEVPHSSGAGPGYYDEDLFEEMPDDNFGQEGTGDEPNWDFFDQPGMDSKDVPLGAPRQINENPVDGVVGHDVGASRTKITEDFDLSPTDQRSKNEDLEAMVADKKSSKTLGQGGNWSHSTSIIGGDSRALQPVQSRSPDHHVASDEPAQKSTPQDKATRRRSSVYDGLQSVAVASDRDSRYTSNGAYWFDPSPALTNPKAVKKQNAIYQIIPTSPSGSDGSSMSSRPMSLDHGNTNMWTPGLPRQWTEYHVESPIEQNLHNDVEKAAIQRDIQKVLNSLPTGLKVPPSTLDFNLVKQIREIPGISTQKFLQVAHILVDQVSQTCLVRHTGDPPGHEPIPDDHSYVHADLSGMNTSASSSSLHQLVNLRVDNNQSRPQGRILKLFSPQIHVRRAEQPLTASTSILGFWDVLNLQPEHGAKDVTAFCIHPNAQTVADGCSNFMQRMKDAYSACALGNHHPGSIAGLTNDDGLLAWATNEPHQANLRSICKRLGDALSAASDLKGMIVVYMTSQSDRMTDYLETCYAFYTLFETFAQSSTDKKNVVDIALQIIPLDFVADGQTLIIPPQSDYIKLALEVYNRLPPPHPEAAPGTCGSAVSVAVAETSVHFRLNTEVSSPLFKHGRLLHVSYSISDDDRWITAAWTDECGKLALTMSYCTQIWRSSPRRQRRDIFKEIWEVSHDLIGKEQGAWRLCVAKTDSYDSDELGEWRHVVDGNPTSKKRCTLVLLSVRLHPLLKLIPPFTQGRNGPMGGPNTYGTPASTPQTSITSPDQLVPATPTPGGSGIVSAPTPPEHGYDPNVESDLTLVDPAEESWSIVLPYGINQTSNVVELRPSMLTGLLMKRKGVKGEDGHASIEVSLFNLIPSAPATEEPWMDELLEDIIKQYRGLVTLSVTRGCIDAGLDCLPWHVATSIRGARVLGEVM